MTVYVVVNEYWDDTTIEGVYASQESAKAAYPKLMWGRCGDDIEAMGLPYGSRLIIAAHVVKS